MAHSYVILRKGVGKLSAVHVAGNHDIHNTRKDQYRRTLARTEPTI